MSDNNNNNNNNNMMSPADLEMARSILKNLASEKYKDRNSLFLKPFDLNEVPGYLESVGEPLDLQTVTQQLESDKYDSLQACLTDAAKIFQNAVTYHGGKSATKWIVKLARGMLNALEKERKKAEKANSKSATTSSTNITATTTAAAAAPPVPAATASAPLIKLKLGKKTLPTSSSRQQQAGKQLPTAAAAKAAAAATTTTATAPIKIEKASSSSSTTTTQPPVKKPKLKLKLSTAKKTTIAASASTTAASSSTKPTVVKAKPTQPKLKIKMSLSKSAAAVAAAAAAAAAIAADETAAATTTTSPTEATSATTAAAKPKISLKLGGGSSSSTTNKAAGTTPSSAGSSSSSTVVKPATTGSRGKELPKGVVMSTSPAAAAASGAATIAAAAASPTASSSSSANKSAKAAATSAASSATASTTAKGKKKKVVVKRASVTASSSSSLTAVTSTAAVAAATAKTRLTPAQQRQCNKILLGLKRRQKPIEKAMTLDSRGQKVKQVMDLPKIERTLTSNSYASLADFCADVRRIFAQVLKDNTNVAVVPINNNNNSNNISSSNGGGGSSGKSKGGGAAAAAQQAAAAAAALPVRTIALNIFQAGEDLMAHYLTTTTTTTVAAAAPYYPRLLYCWRRCMDDVLQAVYSLTNPDGQPTAFYFLHPVSYYCGGQFPPDYMDKISSKKPMDFGTVTGNLLEGKYQTVAEFCTDCRLVVNNCLAYYKHEEHQREDGRLYVEQASRIGQVLDKELDTLIKYDKSAKGAADRAKATAASSPSKTSTAGTTNTAGTTATTSVIKPPISLLQQTLDDLRALKYNDKATKITEPAMTPFEDTVAMAASPDVTEPINLSTIDSRVRSGTYYATPEDFEYEITLLFRNIEVYHSKKGAGSSGGGGVGGEHLVAMAKFGARNFRRIFYAKLRTWEDSNGGSMSAANISSAAASNSQPSSIAATKADTALSSSNKSKATSPLAGGLPSKKLKVDTGNASTSNKGKTGPRISITLSASSSAAATAAIAAAAARAATKSPKTTGGNVAQKKADGQAKPAPRIAVVSNQPVPLHIAIAQVKEAFPPRRKHANLLRWEADCARYFKELLRHPWLSAARPKFIFHVPVPVLFPELREAYSAKIRQPMDLTTVECCLLAGDRYSSPEDFLHDIALTFANAIKFNKDGRDVGDPLSCAYYDASVHLLRYARWLSLETLPDYVEESDYFDEPGPDGLPPFPWKLTTGNLKVAQEEEKSIVLKEPIEKSLEGDRWTWHEAECEKLLKALRHQSDYKRMSFFIQPNYPPDYSGYISKPMDWERVQRTLKKRQYDKFGDVIEDLRLIFSNALKYNARLKGTETVSGNAYSSAEIMSAKLENAIRKMMLSVSDRIERERIDHANAEREMEAADQAEEALIRAAWKKDPESKEGSTSQMNPSLRTDISQKIRLVRRQAPQRQAVSDFEIPFFDDEDESQHERSYVQVVKLQKSMFEKQRQELVKMRQAAAAVSGSVHTRLLQRTIAQQWVEQEFNKIASARVAAAKDAEEGKSSATLQPGDSGSAAGTNTGPDNSTGDSQNPFENNREQIKLSLVSIKPKKKSKKRPRVMMD